MTARLLFLLSPLCWASEDESIFLQTDVQKVIHIDYPASQQPSTGFPNPDDEAEKALIDEVTKKVEGQMMARMTVKMIQTLSEKFKLFKRHILQHMTWKVEQTDLNITKKFNKDQQLAEQCKILENSLSGIIAGAHEHVEPALELYKDYIAGVYIALKFSADGSFGDEWNATMGPVIRVLDNYNHSFAVATSEMSGLHDYQLEQTVRRVHLVNSVLAKPAEDVHAQKTPIITATINLVHEIRKAINTQLPKEYHEKLNKIFETVTYDTEDLIRKLFGIMDGVEDHAKACINDALEYLGAPEDDLFKSHHSAGVKYGLGLVALIIGLLAY